MATAQRVSLCFFFDAHLWCQVSRTLLQYFQRYRLFSILHFLLQTIWSHHWSNLHNRKTSISLKRKKIFQKEKHHSSVFWKAFQISTNYFSLHRHFKRIKSTSEAPQRISSHLETIVSRTLQPQDGRIPLIFCSFLNNVEIIVNKICFWKEKLGSPNVQDR